MPVLLKNQEVIQQSSTVITSLDSLSGLQGTILVPVKLWMKKRGQLLTSHLPEPGLLFAPDDEPEDIACDITRFDLIAIEFPTFLDGRGYSLAKELRNHYGFSGELRATGDVLVDQLLLMQRCGFNSFELRQDQEPESALAALTALSPELATGTLPNRLQQ